MLIVLLSALKQAARQLLLHCYVLLMLRLRRCRLLLLPAMAAAQAARCCFRVAGISAHIGRRRALT